LFDENRHDDSTQKTIAKNPKKKILDGDHMMALSIASLRMATSSSRGLDN